MEPIPWMDAEVGVIHERMHFAYATNSTGFSLGLLCFLFIYLRMLMSV